MAVKKKIKLQREVMHYIANTLLVHTCLLVLISDNVTVHACALLSSIPKKLWVDGNQPPSQPLPFIPNFFKKIGGVSTTEKRARDNCNVDDLRILMESSRNDNIYWFTTSKQESRSAGAYHRWHNKVPTRSGLWTRRKYILSHGTERCPKHAYGFDLFEFQYNEQPVAYMLKRKGRIDKRNSPTPVETGSGSQSTMMDTIYYQRTIRVNEEMNANDDIAPYYNQSMNATATQGYYHADSSGTAGEASQEVFSDNRMGLTSTTGNDSYPAGPSCTAGEFFEDFDWNRVFCGTVFLSQGSDTLGNFQAGPSDSSHRCQSVRTASQGLSQSMNEALNSPANNVHIQQINSTLMDSTAFYQRNIRQVNEEMPAHHETPTNSQSMIATIMQGNYHADSSGTAGEASQEMFNDNLMGFTSTIGKDGDLAGPSGTAEDSPKDDWNWILEDFVNLSDFNFPED